MDKFIEMKSIKGFIKRIIPITDFRNNMQKTMEELEKVKILFLSKNSNIVSVIMTQEKFEEMVDYIEQLEIEVMVLKADLNTEDIPSERYDSLIEEAIAQKSRG